MRERQGRYRDTLSTRGGQKLARSPVDRSTRRLKAKGRTTGQTRHPSQQDHSHSRTHTPIGWNR